MAHNAIMQRITVSVTHEMYKIATPVLIVTINLNKLGF